MENFKDVLQAVSEGAKFTIDLKRKTMRVNGELVIGDGHVIDLPPVLSTNDFITAIEVAYERYKYSRPSERSESRSRNYFRALPEDELSDDDMFFGEARETARFILESRCLAQILGGWQWPDAMGKWFWQSKQDKDLVLLRQWFE